MKIRILSFISGLLLPATLLAQPDSLVFNHKITYYNELTSGGLIGDKDAGIAFSARMIHGIRYRPLSIGIGLGYDSYEEWRTIPFFISTDFDLGAKRNSGLFIQLNYGHAIAQRPAQEDDSFRYDPDGGRMTSLMGGYRINSGNLTFYLLAGYQFQRINYDQTFRWGDIWGPVSSSVERDIERFCVQIGIGIF